MSEWLENHLRRAILTACEHDQVLFGRDASERSIMFRIGRYLAPAVEERTYYAGDMPSDPDSIADARHAFMRWAEEAGPALAEVGAPVRSAMTIGADGARGAVAGQPLMGWSVIEAADSDAAVKLVQDHPFISRSGILQISQPV